MQFSSQRFADTVVAAPVGPVDHPNAQALEEALDPILAAAVAGRGALVLDFAGVGYVSSMGLRVLLMAAKRVRAAEGRIAIAALQPVVQEIFAIARFDHVLDVFPDVRAALRALSPAALAAFDAAAA